MHVVRELWEAGRAGEIPPHELSALIHQHLFSLCPVCAQAFREFQEHKLLPPPSPAVTVQALAEHLHRLRRAERKALKDRDLLLQLPEPSRIAAIQRARSRFRGTALVHALLDSHWPSVDSNPDEAHHLADLAWHVAVLTHGEGQFDSIALSLACKANARRAAGRLRQAEILFAEVRSLLNTAEVRSISGIARIERLEAMLHKDCRRFDAAIECLSRSSLLFQLAGSRVDVARTRITLADVYFYARRPRRALAIVRDAIRLLAPERKDRLYLCARHNQALYLADLGKYDRAARILVGLHPLYEAHGDRWTQLHRLWLEGRIAAGQGHSGLAEAKLVTARDGFVDQGIAYDAALVCLDLALVYLEQSRTADVLVLVDAMIPVFHAQGIQGETLSAWRLLREVTERQNLSAAWLKRLARYLELARYDSALPFEA